ncbi:endonuclease domain-containing protein [Sphingomonas panacisoli]|nr:endonuclease domain-containing protein [Sphingomonas panacisoli]
MTLPEVKLWQWLRGSPSGFRFRRQHPIGHFSLDFYFAAGKLAIEVDGEAHSRGSQPERDAIRDTWLAERGVRTLRIRATDVLNEFDAVTRLILAECVAIPLHQPAAGPPPQLAGEE